MIIDVPASVVNFCLQFLPTLAEFAPAHVAALLPTALAAVASSSASRYSLSSLARQVYGHVRHKSTLGRMLSCRAFRSRDLHWDLVRRVLKVLVLFSGPGAWLVALDATSLQRGAHTKIPGAIHSDQRERNKRRIRRRAWKQRPDHRQVRAKQDTRKGRKTKYFTVLLGVLITPFGVRIPLPRYTCDPKNFHRGRGRPRKKRPTQLDLAKLMLEKLLFILPPGGLELVVIADSLYESKKLVRFAQSRNITFIAPLDSNRCFAKKSSPSQSNKKRIRNRGLKLPWSTFSRLDLVRGKEETASYRRYSQRKTGPKDRRTYWLYHERRTVAELGEVAIVYSWKTPVYEPRRNFGKKSFKVLMCSDPSWSGEKIVEFYEMRWTAIEIFIRELKGHLGFEDYSGLSLPAMERYLDLVLMSFLYLEMTRFAILENPTASPTERKVAASARVPAMKGLIRAEADRQLLSHVREALHFPHRKRQIMAFLDAATQMQQFANP